MGSLKNHVQLSLWDFLDTLPEKDDPVVIDGPIDVHAKPITERQCHCSYGDVVLIISMLRDYVAGLDKVKSGEPGWEYYYKGKLMKIADRFSEQIGYDYDKALAKCLKKAEKETKESDIGGDALILALKKQ